MEERLAKLEAQIAELSAWKTQREQQQVAFPLDDISKNIIGGVIYDGAGSTDTTDDLSISGDPETVQVPASYDGTILLLVDGVRYEIPYINTL